MRFEPRHAFDPALRPTVERTGLPFDIAFLLELGVVDRDTLDAAVRTATKQNVSASAALIAEGDMSAHRYYACLARHLCIPFVAGWPSILPIEDPAAAYRRGCIALADDEPAPWLMAPEGDALFALLRARRKPDIALTTPAHLAAIIHHSAQRSIEQAAVGALPRSAPNLSALGAFEGKAKVVALSVAVLAVVVMILAPRIAYDVVGLAFLAGIVFRLIVSSAAFCPPAPRPPALSDADLPHYTVLVPLAKEEAVVPDILAALRAIDYPRAKLQVLVLIEPEDLTMRRALRRQELPPWLHVVIGPFGGEIRTKPRALNIGLAMARGTLITIYDAEDQPEPDQLRKAAALFAARPDLACVQAKLAIVNGDDAWPARLFALEYAALFDVFNLGTTELALPLALGGTSNHFRISDLRDCGAWDAWNVTEDADLGLRFARNSRAIGSLDSRTFETAPDTMRAWFKQRRRWMKGWGQTFLVLIRDARRACHQLGWRAGIAATLLLVNLVVSPLALLPFLALVTWQVASGGLFSPTTLIEMVEATLAVCVFLGGIASTLWCGYAGLRRRGLLRYWRSLPLMLPYQLMIGAAALTGVYDLWVRPHHWHKTTHHPRAQS